MPFCRKNATQKNLAKSTKVPPKARPDIVMHKKTFVSGPEKKTPENPSFSRRFITAHKEPEKKNAGTH